MQTPERKIIVYDHIKQITADEGHGLETKVKYARSNQEYVEIQSTG